MERISHQEASGVVQVLLQGQQYVENSGLDKKLITLIKFRVSQINSCAYCLDMHFKDGIHAGETPQRLISVGVWRETSYYSPEERAVLAFAEKLTRLPEEESADQILDDLKLYFSKQEIANITLAVIQINSWNRLVRAFGPVPGSYKVRELAKA
jgi:AhpD family alkylhydroperoxidase